MTGSETATRVGASRWRAAQIAAACHRCLVSAVLSAPLLSPDGPPLITLHSPVSSSHSPAVICAAYNQRARAGSVSATFINNTQHISKYIFIYYCCWCCYCCYCCNISTTAATTNGSTITTTTNANTACTNNAVTITTDITCATANITISTTNNNIKECNHFYYFNYC